MKLFSSLPAVFLLIPSALFLNKCVVLHHPGCVYGRHSGCKHQNSFPSTWQMGARWMLLHSHILTLSCCSECDWLVLGEAVTTGAMQGVTAAQRRNQESNPRNFEFLRVFRRVAAHKLLYSRACSLGWGEKGRLMPPSHPHEMGPGH